MPKEPMRDVDVNVENKCGISRRRATLNDHEQGARCHKVLDKRPGKSLYSMSNHYLRVITEHNFLFSVAP
jgi:hypothetical protein